MPETRKEKKREVGGAKKIKLKKDSMVDRVLDRRHRPEKDGGCRQTVPMDWGFVPIAVHRPERGARENHES